jgi:hemoglobin
MKQLSRSIAAIVFSLSSFVGSAAGKDPNLYQRLGGYDAIAAVTDDFLGRLKADEKLGRFFIGLSDDSEGKLRQHVIDLICVNTGGPCTYTGRTMLVSHKGLGITKQDWDRMLGCFGETMKKFNVPQKEQEEIGAIVAPLEKDIVEQKT